jgi:hypothetical protein
MSRSVRLRKYEIAYEECIKKNKHPPQPLKKTRSRRCTPLLEIHNQHQPVKKTRSRRSKPLLEMPQPVKKTRSRSCRAIDTNIVNKKSLKKSPDKKKPLNLYQEFVKKESQKSIYKGVSATERMIAISKEWNIQKTK